MEGGISNEEMRRRLGRSQAGESRLTIPLHRTGLLSYELDGAKAKRRQGIQFVMVCSQDLR